MQKLALIFFLLLATMSLMAQPKDYIELIGEQRTKTITAVTKAHKKLTTLSATFVQEKSSPMLKENLVQKGKMLYKSPKKLRWEYITPQSMVLLFNNDEVTLKNAGKVVANPPKMLSELGSLIMNTLNGSLLTDNRMFKVNYFKSKDNDRKILVVLIPVHKKWQKLYAHITVELSTDTYLAEKVTLTEKKNAVTTITFVDKKNNTTLDDKLFTE